MFYYNCCNNFLLLFLFQYLPQLGFTKRIHLMNPMGMLYPSFYKPITFIHILINSIFHSVPIFYLIDIEFTSDIL